MRTCGHADSVSTRGSTLRSASSVVTWPTYASVVSSDLALFTPIGSQRLKIGYSKKRDAPLMSPKGRNPARRLEVRRTSCNRATRETDDNDRKSRGGDPKKTRRLDYRAGANS